MFLFDTGTVTVKAYVSPTLNFSGAKTGVRYAVSIDDEAPQLVNITADSSNAGWEKSVADNIRILVDASTASTGPAITCSSSGSWIRASCCRSWSSTPAASGRATSDRPRAIVDDMSVRPGGSR